MSRQARANDPTPRSAMFIEGTEALQVLRDLIATLSEREAGVMTLRFGVDDGKPKTLDEIGRIYGVTRERIREIERKGLSNLRSALRDSPLAVRDGAAVVDVADVRRAAPDTSAYETVLVWCAQCHERRFNPGRGALPTSGRPRKYCSNKCRQAAYRERRRLTGGSSVGNSVKSQAPGGHAKR